MFDAGGAADPLNYHLLRLPYHEHETYFRTISYLCANRILSSRTINFRRSSSLNIEVQLIFLFLQHIGRMLEQCKKKEIYEFLAKKW